MYQYRSAQHTIQVGSNPTDRQDVWKGTWASSIKYTPTGSSNSDLQAYQDEYEYVIKAPLNYTDGKSAIHFAGEAYCARWAGFTHGALDSGRLEARKIIYEIE